MIKEYDDDELEQIKDEDPWLYNQMMEIKEELSKAVNNLEESYDAFYMMNRYSWKDNTHAKEFEILSKLAGDKVPQALAWIHDCYDCYYKAENTEDSPFNYLRGVINNEM